VLSVGYINRYNELRAATAKLEACGVLIATTEATPTCHDTIVIVSMKLELDLS
jgi:hypothetical protein